MLIEQYFPRYNWLIIQFATMLGTTGLKNIVQHLVRKNTGSSLSMKSAKKNCDANICMDILFACIDRIVTLQVRGLCKYYVVRLFYKDEEESIE